MFEFSFNWITRSDLDRHGLRMVFFSTPFNAIAKRLGREVLLNMCSWSNSIFSTKILRSPLPGQHFAKNNAHFRSRRLTDDTQSKHFHVCTYFIVDLFVLFCSAYIRSRTACTLYFRLHSSKTMYVLRTRTRRSSIKLVIFQAKNSFHLLNEFIKQQP